MKLNCDLGESFAHWQLGNDADIDQKIMPHIHMANIACGFHAAEPLTMAKTVKLAVENNVTIGAHPSYNDLQGFGRRSMKVSEQELMALIQYQVGALQAIAYGHGSKVSYVKPHGALYNDMMAEQAIFITVCKAIALINKNSPKCYQNNQDSQNSLCSEQLYLVVQALPNSQTFQEVADIYGVYLRFEAFADRNYQDNGLLVPRSEPDALLTSNEEIVNRCQQLIETGCLQSVNGKALNLKVDTLCVHGDQRGAVELVQALYPLMPK